MHILIDHPHDRQTRLLRGGDEVAYLTESGVCAHAGDPQLDHACEIFGAGVDRVTILFRDRQ